MFFINQYFTNTQKPSCSSSTSLFSWNLEIDLLINFLFPHHHKPGCPPSWQWMDSLWNWRRAGWSAALYGADKTPGRATTLHRTSSIISCGQDRPGWKDYGGGIVSFLVFKKVWKCCFTIHPILYSSSWWDCTRSPGLQPFLRSRTCPAQGNA